MAGLGKEVELVEPSFKDVVILYREKVEEAGPTAKGGASSNGNTAKRVEAEVTSSRKRNLHIKRFQDIPMADVEMVFPDKVLPRQPSLYPFHALRYCALSFVAFVVSINLSCLL
jgi:hypothetical protein